MHCGKIQAAFLTCLTQACGNHAQKGPESKPSHVSGKWVRSRAGTRYSWSNGIGCVSGEGRGGVGFCGASLLATRQQTWLCSLCRRGCGCKEINTGFTGAATPILCSLGSACRIVVEHSRTVQISCSQATKKKKAKSSAENLMAALFSR